MRAVIVYESMYGNTHAIAEAIARGLDPGNDVTVVPVARAGPELLAGADLVVVGGPTHVHSLSRPNTRKAAVDKAGSTLTLDSEAAADGPGVREWLGSLAQVSAKAAAFDTRVDAPALFTGRASKLIAQLLRRHGLTVIAQASFLVTKDGHVRDHGVRDGTVMI